MKRLQMFTVAVAISFGALGGTCFAQAAGQWRNPQQIYTDNCHFCHDTGVGPVLFGRHLPLRKIMKVVRDGKGPMPAFRQSQINHAELVKLAEMISRSSAPAARNARKKP